MSDYVDEVRELLNKDAFILDGLDECVIGHSHTGWLIYSYEKIVEHFMKSGIKDRGEAEEYVDFNVVGLGPPNFIIMYEKGA